MNYSFRFSNETNKNRLGRARNSFGLAPPTSKSTTEKALEYNKTVLNRDNSQSQSQSVFKINGSEPSSSLA